MIYLLKMNDIVVGYDEFDGFVIEAESEKEARLVASCEYSDNSIDWLDSKKSICQPLEITGITRIILSSFRNG